MSVEKLTKEKEALEEKVSEQEENNKELTEKNSELTDVVRNLEKEVEDLRNELDEVGDRGAVTTTPILLDDGQNVEVGRICNQILLILEHWLTQSVLGLRIVSSVSSS